VGCQFLDRQSHKSDLNCGSRGNTLHAYVRVFGEMIERKIYLFLGGVCGTCCKHVKAVGKGIAKRACRVA